MMFHYSVGESGLDFVLYVLYFFFHGGVGAAVGYILCVSILSLLYNLQLVWLFRQINITMILSQVRIENSKV